MRGARRGRARPLKVDAEVEHTACMIACVWGKELWTEGAKADCLAELRQKWPIQSDQGFSCSNTFLTLRNPPPFYRKSPLQERQFLRANDSK